MDCIELMVGRFAVIWPCPSARVDKRAGQGKREAPRHIIAAGRKHKAFEMSAAAAKLLQVAQVVPIDERQPQGAQGGASGRDMLQDVEARRRLIIGPRKAPCANSKC